VAEVENVAVWPGATVRLEGWVMIAGTPALGEVDAMPPPHPTSVSAQLKDRHTTATACKRMIGKTLSLGSGLEQWHLTIRPGS